MRLLIIGNPEPIHLGAHLLAAARELALDAAICDTRAAFAVPYLLRTASWRLLGRRPPLLDHFGTRVLARCQAERPTVLLATGLAPLSAKILARLGQLGIVRINYLSDDPWNPAHYAPWFLQALPHYDLVCTPRHANQHDLKQAGCRYVTYVPFGYNPALHFHEPPEPGAEQQQFDCDLLFAGGADADRLPVMVKLSEAGFKLALYGGYWERDMRTRPFARGHADPPTLRKAVAGARVVLCLVRRANRDGHVMRSFEVPAMGGCMLTEYTTEHQALFGNDGECVRYFHNDENIQLILGNLLTQLTECSRLAHAAKTLITQGQHTYTHRLATMLAAVDATTGHQNLT